MEGAAGMKVGKGQMAQEPGETEARARQTRKPGPTLKAEHGGIVVLDFGGQYTQLIARRVREQGVFSAILPCTTSLEEVRRLEPTGIILSGGPSWCTTRKHQNAIRLCCRWVFRFWEFAMGCNGSRKRWAVGWSRLRDASTVRRS